jgi:hypothetical protein
VLSEAANVVAPGLHTIDARLTMLEAAASVAGGWDLPRFWAATGLMPRIDRELAGDPLPWAEKLLSVVSETPIPVPLALSALARERVESNERRTKGAYYTDWRLAEMLATEGVSAVRGDGPWIDPACGTGILLAAAAMSAPEAERNHVIENKLCGADLSQRALRGALLSVASLTSRLSAIERFATRLVVQDSLRSAATWTTLAPDGAALIIGNPPWERMRVSRHELATSQGHLRKYGQRYEFDIDTGRSRMELLAYLEAVAGGAQLQGRGEHDMYKLFLELGMGLVANHGVLAFLLPAGLIRSQGTEDLRRALDGASELFQVSVLENRARHFAIDTRFKFLALVARIGADRRTPLKLRVADRAGVLPRTAVRIGRRELRELRPDLTIPEVKTKSEWTLFRRLSEGGEQLGRPGGRWQPEYRREVDMTLDRAHFTRAQSADTLPIIEGRHVSQYRWRAKRYVNGEGRAALWQPRPLELADSLVAQWFVPEHALNAEAQARSLQSRIGFCDITGQTNERSLLVARIPAGVVCGNKVPTVTFPDGSPGREDLFVALVNSLVADWMMRRLLTTTVNFFLFNSLPLPGVDPDSSVGLELIDLARRVADLEGRPSVDLWAAGQWRARIDALVAASWGATVEDMELVLADFPLLDRGQPPLPGESRSTVTGDCIVAELSRIYRLPHSSEHRSREARALGAVPYVPAEFA